MRRAHWILVSLVVSGGVVPVWAGSSKILSGLKVHADSDGGTVVRIDCRGTPAFTVFRLTRPPRLVVELSDAVAPTLPAWRDISTWAVSSLSVAAVGKRLRLILALRRRVTSTVNIAGGRLSVRVQALDRPPPATDNPSSGKREGMSPAMDRDKIATEGAIARMREARRRAEEADAEASRAKKEHGVLKASLTRSEQAAAQALMKLKDATKRRKHSDIALERLKKRTRRAEKQSRELALQTQRALAALNATRLHNARTATEQDALKDVLTAARAKQKTVLAHNRRLESDLARAQVAKARLNREVEAARLVAARAERAARADKARQSAEKERLEQDAALAKKAARQAQKAARERLAAQKAALVAQRAAMNEAQVARRKISILEDELKRAQIRAEQLRRPKTERSLRRDLAAHRKAKQVELAQHRLRIATLETSLTRARDKADRAARARAEGEAAAVDERRRSQAKLRSAVADAVKVARRSLKKQAKWVVSAKRAEREAIRARARAEERRQHAERNLERLKLARRRSGGKIERSLNVAKEKANRAVERSRAAVAEATRQKMLAEKMLSNANLKVKYAERRRLEAERARRAERSALARERAARLLAEKEAQDFKSRLSAQRAELRRLRRSSRSEQSRLSRQPVIVPKAMKREIPLHHRRRPRVSRTLVAAIEQKAGSPLFRKNSSSEEVWLPLAGGAYRVNTFWDRSTVVISGRGVGRIPLGSEATMGAIITSINSTLLRPGVASIVVELNRPVRPTTTVVGNGGREMLRITYDKVTR